MYPHNLHLQPRPVCCCTTATIKDSQPVEIILLKSELIHDIEAVITKIERGRPADAPQLMQEDVNDSYEMARHIDTAVNQAVSRCQAYLLLPSPFVQRIAENHTHAWEEKSIYLAFPRTWPPHCVGPLRDAVHNYIVYRTAQLFLMLTDEKAAQQCDLQAMSCWDDINSHLNTRLGATNIYPSFLG